MRGCGWIQKIMARWWNAVYGADPTPRTTVAVPPNIACTLLGPVSNVGACAMSAIRMQAAAEMNKKRMNV